MGSRARENAEYCSGSRHGFPGTKSCDVNWVDCAPRAGARPSGSWSMQNRLLAVATIAAAMSAPVAAQAQTEITTGVVRGGSVVTEREIIAVEQRPAFREYVIREHVPTYTIGERVVVGGVLPEAGVTYYDVPQTFGASQYRYTVVNGQTVLVEPRSRRIVQVVD
jgi:hypothetical protein